MRRPVPFIELCRLESLPDENGCSRVAVEVEGPLLNGHDAAHGGLLMTMLDVALGRAARCHVEGATSFVTIDMQVAFLLPGRGRLIATGRALRGGRSFVFAEGEVRDAAGEMVARASGLFRPIVPRPA